MTSRRQVRGARALSRGAAASALEGDLAILRTSPDDPLWRDVTALRGVFGDLINDRVTERLRMGGRVDNMVRGAWAVAHGLESATYPKMADWHALRRLLEEDGLPETGRTHS